jgi:ATP-dependent RNA helicase DeaD
MKEELMNKFNTLNIDNDILKAIEKKQYEEMTEVQEAVIPLAIEKLDIIAQAPTGTGKTAAFAIPILQTIDAKLEKVQALILAPTRELAVQITNEIKELSYYKPTVNVVCVYGGEYIEKQITALKKHPQIIVATPGRLMDHMRRGTIKLNYVSMMVLDEADEMLNMGFREDIDTILASITNEHQTMLFSATISPEIEEIGKNYLHKPEVVRVNRNEMNVPLITQQYIEVKESDKIEVISRIIDINDYKLVMVFCNTKKAVDEVTSSLLTRGYIVEALHGDMKQMQRDRVMNRFRTGMINILVASDVAARGLDIDDVEVVFNYDIPTDDEYYIHRIGRTGRAKHQGLAITLITKKEKYRLRQIMAYAHSMITSMEIPSLEKVMKVRVERVLKQALETKNKKYQEIIKNSIKDLVDQNIDASDLITGLILLQMNSNSDDEIKEEKPNKAKITRIFLGLGRKDNLKVPQLTDLITKRTSITNADINNIDMHEDFTFLEIPTNLVDELAFAFSKTMNGRRIIVEEAKEKPKVRSSSKRDDRKRAEHRYDRRDRKYEPFTKSERKSSGKSTGKKKLK